MSRPTTTSKGINAGAMIDDLQEQTMKFQLLGHFIKKKIEGLSLKLP